MSILRGFIYFDLIVFSNILEKIKTTYKATRLEIIVDRMNIELVKKENPPNKITPTVMPVKYPEFLRLKKKEFDSELKNVLLS